MEVLVLVGGGLASGAMTFALLPPGRGGCILAVDGVGPLGRVRPLCGRVGRRGAVVALGRVSACRVVASELVGALRRQGQAYGDSEVLGLLVMGCLGASLVAGLVALSPIGILVGLVGSCVGIGLRASAIERRRRRELVDEMPDVFRSLSVSLGSGKTLSQAIEYVGTHGRGSVGRRFSHAALSIRCGASVSEALEELGEELDAPGAELLATALSISQRTGSPLRNLLLSSAKMVEGKAELERTLVTKTAQARLSARIVCVLPMLMVATLSLLSPEFRVGVASTRGMVCLGIAVLLDGTAILVIRRLMGSISA